MTDARAIAAKLVDIKNVGVHKSVRLIIDAPQEQAKKIIDLIGWPTMANPIDVAVARLDPESQRDHKEVVPDYERAETKPRPVQSPGSVGAEKVRRSFDELPPPQQAGILCNEPAFAKFLEEQYGNVNRPEATVRAICRVSSRSEITQGNSAWQALVSNYHLWQREAEVVPA